MVGMPGSGGGIPGLHPGLFRAPSYAESDSTSGTESPGPGRKSTDGPGSRASDGPASRSSNNPSSLGELDWH
jgi:hypothetical protein